MLLEQWHVKWSGGGFTPSLPKTRAVNDLYRKRASLVEQNDTRKTTGLLISIIASDSDTIGDTFEVSISRSPILLRGSIAIGIGDTFLGCIGIDYRRYF